MNIYKSVPEIQNEKYLFRFFDKKDLEDLLKVYSDKKALPYFNSDNCDGDIFFYNTKEKMEKAFYFWKLAYENGWFVRFSIIDKEKESAIGTAELCIRKSADKFNDMGIMRIDVLSDYETEEELFSIISLITPYVNDAVGSSGIITKAPLYAVDRIEALKRAGYKKSEFPLEGKNNVLYYDYWTHK